MPLEPYVARVLAGEAGATASRRRSKRWRSRFGRSRSRIADVTARTDSISAIRRTVRSSARRRRRPNARPPRRPAGSWCATASPASIYYTASCGGRTEMPSAVWPGADDPPFLPSKADDACGGAPAWTAELSRGRPAARVSRGGLSGAIGCETCSIASRNGSGRVARLQSGRVEAGSDFRSGSAGRRRPDARLAVHQEHRVRAARAGRIVPLQRSRVGTRRRPVRHRIGAARRAGSTAEAILARYFPGLAISRRPAVGLRRRPGSTGVGPRLDPASHSAKPEFGNRASGSNQSGTARIGR